MKNTSNEHRQGKFFIVNPVGSAMGIMVKFIQDFAQKVSVSNFFLIFTLFYGYVLQSNNNKSFDAWIT